MFAAETGGIRTHVATGHQCEGVCRVEMTPKADAVALLTEHDDLDFDHVQRKERWIVD
jgi:hypothetical protein